MRAYTSIAAGGPVRKVRFSPGGDQILTVSSDGVLLLWAWDRAAGLRRLGELHLDERPGRGVRINTRFLPDGSRLAVSGRGQAIEIRRLPDLALLHTLGATADYGCLSVSRGGHLLLAPCWYPYDERVGSRTEVFRDGGPTPSEWFWHTDTDSSLHPEGEILAVLSNDQGGCAVRFVGLSDRLETYSPLLYTGALVEGVAFSPDGGSIAWLGGPRHLTIEAFDFPSLRRRFTKAYRPIDGADRPKLDQERLAYSPDSSRLLCPFPTGHVVEYDALDGRETRRWDAHEGAVFSIDIDHARSILASGGADGRLNVWELDYPPGVPERHDAARTEAFRRMARVVPPHDEDDFDIMNEPEGEVRIEDLA